MSQLNFIQMFAIWVLPVLFAITLHEAAHGWVAYRLGDPTAAILGRLSLNPIKHIDPVGTILVPGILLVLGGFIFGWAKPVPVNWRHLKNPRRDMALVAIAGPLSNLAMAIIWALIAKLSIFLTKIFGQSIIALVYMGKAGIAINIALMILNFLPIPPLDGSRVLAVLLPKTWVAKLDSIEPYGFFILLALIASGILSTIISPFFAFFKRLIIHLFGL